MVFFGPLLGGFGSTTGSLGGSGSTGSSIIGFLFGSLDGSFDGDLSGGFVLGLSFGPVSGFFLPESFLSGSRRNGWLCLGDRLARQRGSLGSGLKDLLAMLAAHRLLQPLRRYSQGILAVGTTGLNDLRHGVTPWQVFPYDSAGLHPVPLLSAR